MRWDVLVLISWCSRETIALLYPIVDVNKVYKYTPPEEEITFHLYNCVNITQDNTLFINDPSSVDQSRFDPDIPTKVIVHGWTHGKDVPWLREMRETMAATCLWNVIVVDWAPLSHVIYIEARLHTPVVAKQVAKMLLFLNGYASIKMSSVHIVGHSMGAQIAAFTGYKIKEAIGESIGRITGLDPAAPLYEWPHVEYLDEVLDPTDATFVDVIHTNARGLGMVTPAGHVDYYPNGGENQPGCGFWDCSHLRSCELWTASIKKPDLFRAYPYKSWDEFLEEKVEGLQAYPMGIAASKNIPQGTYFLETDDEYEQYLTTKTTIQDSFNL